MSSSALDQERDKRGYEDRNEIILAGHCSGSPSLRNAAALTRANRHVGVCAATSGWVVARSKAEDQPWGRLHGVAARPRLPGTRLVLGGRERPVCSFIRGPADPLRRQTDSVTSRHGTIPHLATLPSGQAQRGGGRDRRLSPPASADLHAMGPGLLQLHTAARPAADGRGIQRQGRPDRGPRQIRRSRTLSNPPARDTLPRSKLEAMLLEFAACLPALPRSDQRSWYGGWPAGWRTAANWTLDTYNSGRALRGSTVIRRSGLVRADRAASFRHGRGPLRAADHLRGDRRLEGPHLPRWRVNGLCRNACAPSRTASTE